MRFQITDVGRIRKADIKLDGITVIAGENNTGKSTVGKALFAYANADGDLERNIKEEVAAEIQLAMFTTQFDGQWGHPRFMRPIIDMMVDELIGTDVTVQSLGKWLRDMPISSPLLSEKASKAASDYLKKLGGRSRKAIAVRSRIVSLLTRSRQTWKNIILNKIMRHLFNEQAHSLLPESNEDYDLKLFSKSENESFSHCLLLDDPAQVALVASGFESEVFRKRMAFNSSISEGIYVMDASTIAYIIEHEEYSHSSEKIVNLLSGIYDGSIGFNEQYEPMLREIFPTTDGIKLVNASMGIRPLVLLKSLVARGIMRSDLLIVLDEPEVHLHPAWQVVYAQALVNIYREYGTRFLVTTHSPYFFKTLSVLTRQMSDSNGLTTYRATSSSDGAVSFRETDQNEWDDLYEAMIEPFDKITALEYM
ncbi:AAA family ATPase [Bifidobacterium pseudocatenulatum]|uniref:AAA family ATPase n=1 Tax=Bifidobacterium pseudocatenulatum TaxID=28026 RepID=UPI000E490FE4|nr:AAA family ATPase [Bifidobacterium pseudocatenulatum]RHG79452.1 hypothetical protein DW239_07055 [Bifidobacterium pseudocatenulatum]RHG83749.1 hypothetical protein DW238_07820 [Bifidobacterium pseudocatenulatum]RHG97005.1 hypothetical protein DW232_08135 [Bifidobacterium pseudocatenulatum]